MERPIERWVRLAGIVLTFAAGFALAGMIVGRTRQTATMPLPVTAPIDPALIAYREIREIPTGLRASRGIALTPVGQLCVVGDRQYRLFDGAGARLADVSLPDSPQCVAVTESGMIVIGYRNRVETRVYTHPERPEYWPMVNGKPYLTAVAVTKSSIWIADAGNRRVYCFKAGKLLRRIGNGLEAPSPHLDVAVGRDGLVWMANPGRHRLEGYAPDGTLQRQWGTASTAVEGFTGCCNPVDFALLPDGRFVTAEKGTPRVKIYRRDGVFECVVASSGSFDAPDAIADLAVDTKGRVYVLDRRRNTVRVFASNTK